MGVSMLLVNVLVVVVISLISGTGGEDDIVTLPFGDPAGDRLGPYRNDEISPAITLSTMFPFYGRDENTVYISENGVISFRSPVTDPFPRPLPFSTDTTTSTPAFIAAYWADINTAKNGGAVFYREMTAENHLFCAQKSYVLQLIREGFGGSVSGFDPTLLFVVTWDAVHGFGTGKNAVTFQVVMATDSKQSYVLLLYSDVRWDMSNGQGALVGFNAGDGEKSFTHPLSEKSLLLDLDRETNSRRLGVFVYRVDQNDVEEPAEGQNKEEICALECVRSQELCRCPVDRVLDSNGVNCVYPPVAVEFVNNTPAATEEGGVMVMLRANRPDAEMQCQILRTNHYKDNCTSGMYQRTGLSPKAYIVRVVASVPGTSQRAVLRGVFKVPEKDVCSVTIVNKKAEVKGNQAIVEFIGSESVKDFRCRTDNRPPVLCTSPFVTEELSRGSHRVIVVPIGCGRKRKSASVWFRVE